MPPPIPTEKRAAIVADVQAGQMSRNAIGRKHGVSSSTVSRIADQARLDHPFDRTATQNATAAAQADMKARRATLASDLLDDVAKLRERAWSEYTYYERGATGPMRVTLDLPPLGEVRNAYTAAGICMDKHLALTKNDADTGATEAKSLLAGLGEALNSAAGHIDEPSGSDTTSKS